MSRQLEDFDVYCLKCKKKGRYRDLPEPKPFIYDGAYECTACKRKSPKYLSTAELKTELNLHKEALRLACDYLNECPDKKHQSKCEDEDCVPCCCDYFLTKARGT